VNPSAKTLWDVAHFGAMGSPERSAPILGFYRLSIKNSIVYGAFSAHFSCDSALQTGILTA
jgi:hypothetical protein